MKYSIAFSLNLSYNDFQEIFHYKNEIDLFLNNKTLYYYNIKKDY